MLLVSFCDIVTITICAMFMAMIVVIDTASKIPVVSPIPVARASTNMPVYFECRDDMIYPIDVPGLKELFSKTAETYAKGTGQDAAEKLVSFDIGNKYYKIDGGLAALGILGIRPRATVEGVRSNELAVAAAAAKAKREAEFTAAASKGHGGGHSAPVHQDTTSAAELAASENNAFMKMLNSMDNKSQTCVFYVRDTGFHIYRFCRGFVVSSGFRHSWEYVDADEPITFEGMMTNPGRQ